MAQETFLIGDYVIVSSPLHDDWEGYTFKIVEFTFNLFGNALVRVQDIARPGSRPTSFYPFELSWEDGTRPAV
jgi:hypothetical protein